MNAPTEGRGLFHTWEQIAADPKLWVALLWRAMWTKTKGYHRRSLRHTGRGTDRRKDKLEGELAGYPKWFRSYRTRYAAPPIKQSRRQISRARSRMFS